jgi:hypothetical protein
MLSRKISIPLIVLGISIFGGGMTFLIFYIFTDIQDVPTIQIEIMRNDADPNKIITKITNNGKAWVTHLGLTIRTPGEITDYTAFTSVHHMTLKNISSNILKANISKFAPGSGSEILIYTTIKDDENIRYDNYLAYAVYDQGSVKRELSPTAWEEASHQFNIQHATIRKSVIVALIIIMLSIIAWIISRYLDSLKAIYTAARKNLK